MRGHRIAIVAALLAGLLCLGGAWVTYEAFAKADAVKSERDDSLHQLQNIYARNPFPCGTNVLTIRADRERLNTWIQELGQDLRAGTAVTLTNNISPSLFIQQLQRTSRELESLSLAAGGKALPDGFAFGFGQYLGVGALMPKPEDVARLARQLRMADAVVREILASRVNTLDQVEREVFESAVAEAGPATGVHVHRPAPVRPATVRTAVATAPGSRYSREHLVFTFSATEKALDEVLNRLAAMPQFVAVTEVEIHREERGLRVPDKPPEADKIKALPPDRGLRVVSGPEVSSMLKARLQVDVYMFEGV